ncbi:MAG: universal stress protein UspA [Anaerosolibacter sp.]|jgi:K+-sensing histidine kinase KdpD|uniref:universal stress protein n=1 Tax=Anaerosolibacter sp. TaxID=1872527 RepID=UPI00262D0BA7|nr:universal stress protein [Anaerosolibacter sp.]MDF2546068.1 universal stress protein UspA [Anaerosolibacter sp.]
MKPVKNVMVCVTQQKTCERLIRRGAELRDTYEGQLFVIHVAQEGWNFLGKSKEGDALEYLFEKSKAYGANLTVLRSHDVLATLKEQVEKNNIDIIVMGEAGGDHEGTSIISNLGKRLHKDVIFDIVPAKLKKKVV